MSYNDRGYSGPSLKVGGIVLAGLLSIFVVPHVRNYMDRQQEMGELSSPGMLDTRLGQDPVIGPAAVVLKTRFPSDYSKMSTAILAGADARNYEAMGDAIGARIGEVVRRDGHYLQTAPATALMTLAASERQLVDTMPPTSCAAYLKGTPIAEPSRPERAVRMGKVLAARLAAIADGRDHPRQWAVPDDSIQRDLLDGLAANGASAPAQQLFTGERTTEQATDDTLCEAQRALLRTVLAMPADAGARVYSRLAT
ncbi:hypothetical protein GGQ80_002636 [Sphingomonas jinjuensis]|uniref:Uncharacterized protein n=1 Tax=Sphingomonas jinjuensis TaxID=535907 RepID=A0A840F9Q3_9SPHN|nr:hypothetical protein [Sphingomonas jinjuensis]MBB4154720.1 hypothetical protein [Sphingomonas jinjuensis]